MRGAIWGLRHRLVPVSPIRRHIDAMSSMITHQKASRAAHRYPHAFVMAMFIAHIAQADHTIRTGELMLPPGSIQASLGDRMRLFGTPIEIRAFSVPLPVARTARALSKRYPSLFHMAVYPQRVLLSGYVADQFWVLSLDSAGPRATYGTLSIQKETDSARESGVSGNVACPRDSASLLRRWLPAGARLRLQFEQDEPDGRVTQQIWTSAVPVASAWAALRTALRQAHWHAEAVTSVGDRWRRAHCLLHVTIVPVEDGSGILLQQHDGASF